MCSGKLEAEQETEPKGTAVDATQAKTRTEKKQFVQDVLMDGLSISLGYWTEKLSDSDRDALGEDGLAELQVLMQEQANRVAKMFGYEKAWVS
jgi:hypothetical protein